MILIFSSGATGLHEVGTARCGRRGDTSQRDVLSLWDSLFRPRAVRLQLGQMFFRPATKRVQRFNQSPTQFRE